MSNKIRIPVEVAVPISADYPDLIGHAAEKAKDLEYHVFGGLCKLSTSRWLAADPKLDKAEAEIVREHLEEIVEICTRSAMETFNEICESNNVQPGDEHICVDQQEIEGRLGVNCYNALVQSKIGATFPTRHDYPAREDIPVGGYFSLRIGFYFARTLAQFFKDQGGEK